MDLFYSRTKSCFAAFRWMILAIALNACATAPPIATEMPTGAATSPPLGAMLFCAANAAECVGDAHVITRVEVTLQRLQELRDVQRDVNRRIDPSAAAEVAWHYAANGKGTCVQYAMEKRRQLIALGWPASALQLATVTTRQGEGHLVLVAATLHGELVLDNLFHDIMPWQVLPYRWIARQDGASLVPWVSINAKVGA